MPHRQVVCFIEIKLIIFHACTHAATVSYTFTRYYLSKVSWLWNTLSKLKVGNVPKPDIMSCGAFFGSQRLPSLSVCPSLKSAANWKLSISFSLSKSLFFSSLHRWTEVSSSRRLKPSGLWWNAAINFKCSNQLGEEKRLVCAVAHSCTNEHTLSNTFLKKTLERYFSTFSNTNYLK